MIVATQEGGSLGGPWCSTCVRMTVPNRKKPVPWSGLLAHTVDFQRALSIIVITLLLTKDIQKIMGSLFGCSERGSDLSTFSFVKKDHLTVKPYFATLTPLSELPIHPPYLASPPSYSSNADMNLAWVRDRRKDANGADIQVDAQD